MSACNIRDDGATVSCRTCGLAWASDARVRPCCPRGLDRRAEAGSRWEGLKPWLVGLCIGLALNGALGLLIVVAMVRGCAA